MLRLLKTTYHAIIFSCNRKKEIFIYMTTDLLADRKLFLLSLHMGVLPWVLFFFNNATA